jgi:chromosome condensin MukBEF complex kleisin-like MukF subunit
VIDAAAAVATTEYDEEAMDGEVFLGLVDFFEAVSRAFAGETDSAADLSASATGRGAVDVSVAIRVDGKEC